MVRGKQQVMSSRGPPSTGGADARAERTRDSHRSGAPSRRVGGGPRAGAIAQSVRAPGCLPGGCGFTRPLRGHPPLVPPHNESSARMGLCRAPPGGVAQREHGLATEALCPTRAGARGPNEVAMRDDPAAPGSLSRSTRAGRRDSVIPPFDLESWGTRAERISHPRGHHSTRFTTPRVDANHANAADRMHSPNSRHSRPTSR